MPTGSRTKHTEQRILNESRDSIYDAIDVIPFFETTVGSVAARGTATVTGAKVGQDVHISSSDVSFGGGTQYTEGATDATITGTVVMWEDAADTIVAASGAKPFPVEIIAGAGSGGTAAADDADFTAGTTSGTPAMGVYESTPTNVTDNDMGIVGITQARRLKTSSTIDAAIPAGNNNIGDVDVASSALPTGASTSAKQDTIIGHVDGIETLLGTIDTDTGNIATSVTDIPNVIGTDGAAGPSKAVSVAGTQSTGELQEVQVDADGQLQIDVISSALPSGAATSAKQDTGNTSLGTIAGAVSGTEMQVDVVTSALPSGASTLAEQQSQTTHLATIAGDTTSIQTATELLDDTVYVDDADWTDNTSKHLLVGGLYQATPQTVTDGDVAPFNITTNGALHVAQQGTVAVTQSGTWDEVGINDSGNSITVDATNLDIRDLTNADVVTAELSAVDNAVLDTIDAVLDTINAKLVTGTDIGDVTINNAAGAAAVNIQDGGNTITVDGTVTANMGTVTADPFGANADAASATGSISAKLRGIATALGVTALDLGSGTGGSRTLRTFRDTAQFVGGSGTVTSATQRVSLATNVALPAGTNAIGKLAANSGVDIGDVDVTSIAAGTNAIGNVGMTPRTSGGLLIKNCTSGDGSTALTSTAQAIKASAGQLFGWYIFNPNTVTAWVIIYNTAAASVTVGTTNPAMVIGIPAGSAANVVNPMGIEFTNAGWSAAAVMTSAAGNTAPTTALDANFFYI